MSKTRTIYICTNCGSTHNSWMGKCSDCGSWDTLKESQFDKSATVDPHRGSSWVESKLGTDIPTATSITEIMSSTGPIRRLPTGITEFDRVLGGSDADPTKGLVPGSVVLVGGEPGIGKSTLLLQAAGAWASPINMDAMKNKQADWTSKVLYVSSEESSQQIQLRADRLGVADADGLFVLADTNLARIIDQIRKIKPDVVVIDSIQMIYKADLEAAPGSVTQLRRCCSYALPQVLGETVALTLGAPTTGLMVPVVCLAGTVAFAAGLWTLRRERLDQWLFYAFVLVGSPASLLMVVRPEYIYPRYFLVCLPFFILLLAHLLARFYRQGAPGKLLCAALLVAVCGPNMWRTAHFLRDGRGHYLEALLYLAENTDGSKIELGSDSDFRTPKLLAFYAPYLPDDKQVHYYAAERWPPRGPEWLINHRQAPDYRPKQEITAYHGIRYVLQREFRYSGMSGFHWFVYRREDLTPPNVRSPANQSK